MDTDYTTLRMSLVVWNGRKGKRIEKKYLNYRKGVGPTILKISSQFEHNQTKGIADPCTQTHIHASSKSNLVGNKYIQQMGNKTLLAILKGQKFNIKICLLQSTTYQTILIQT